MKKICLLLSMRALLLCSCSKTKQAEEPVAETVDVKRQVEERESEKIITHIAQDKDETVYVTRDPSGNVLKTEVNVILRSGDSETIEDVTDLKDIKNTASDEEFTLKDGTLIFENKGDDIHYRGYSDKQLPVSVKVTYYLDGAEISPEELKGKSGRVTIRFDYVNNTAAPVNGYTLPYPFSAITIVMLDDEVFSNIEVENARLLEYDGSYMVLITAFPGLRDSLRLGGYELTKEIKLTEWGSFTADVHDFSLDYTATILSNGIFKDLKDKDLSDIYSFNKDAQEFKDSSKELTDNTSALYSACGTLKDGIKKYTDGVSRVDEGLGTVKGYADTLSSSLSQMSRAVSGIRDSSIAGKVERVKAQAQKISADIDAMSASLRTAGTALDELDALIDASGATEEEKARMKEKVAGCRQALAGVSRADMTAFISSLDRLLGEIQSLSSLGSVSGSMAQLSELAQGVSRGLQGIKDATNRLVAANKQLNDGAGMMRDAAGKFDSAMKDFVNNDVDDIMKLGDDSLVAIANRRKALRKLDKEYGCFSGLMEGKTGKTVFIIETGEI